MGVGIIRATKSIKMDTNGTVTETVRHRSMSDEYAQHRVVHVWVGLIQEKVVRLELYLHNYEGRCSLCKGKVTSQTKEIHAAFPYKPKVKVKNLSWCPLEMNQLGDRKSNL